jgi:hypothetical protein
MPGTTGSMGIEGTLEPLSAGVDTIVVKTVDGAKHVFRYTKDLLVHGGKGTGVPSLQGLREGSTVVVHYTGTGADTTALEIDRFGDDGLKVTEGVITRVDRGRKQIVLKFDSGKTETFELTDRAAKDVGKDVDRAASASTRVAVYYVDEAGRRVVHFFKKVS